jgi:pimeloyl-ACP methyl ester carboxylesterase
MPAAPALPIVLVHGGGHGAWCWEPLLPLLGASAVAVDLPPESIRGGPGRFEQPAGIEDLTLADWADAVLARANAEGFAQFVLVGHSLAGLTICEVARRAPDRVAHLVFVSALVPTDGENAVAALPPEMIERVAGGLNEATMTDMFCSDLDDAQTQFVLDHVGGEVVQVMLEPVRRAGIPPELPKTYIRLAQDHALPLAAQNASIAALTAVPGGRVDVVEIDAGHNVMISRPADLARVLEGIARPN